MSPVRSLVVLALILVAILIAPAAPAREFRVADTQVEDYPTVQAVLHMSRLIEEQTGGRHRLRVFHSRQLGEEQDTIEQTRVGAIDLNRTNVAPMGAFVPAANVLALPFLFRSKAHLHAVLDGPIGEEILASFEPHGFVALTFYDSGARSIYTRNRPVRSLADLAGLRLRVQQSDLMVAMVKAMGAVPVQLPYGQVETALATGLIDGAENNWPSYVTTGHYKVAPHYILTEHTMSPEVLVMSRRAWDSLSADDKAIFRAAALASNRAMRQQWNALEERSREQARAVGTTVVGRFDRDAFVAAMAGVHAGVLNDPALRRLVERIRESE
ncbi:Solute-binding protein [Rhodoplanes serenus]|uniref:Solute-binding protein n=1 Tax=Rhodoplanes serenus TaxID=200615 RepID=A0A3S4FEB4_9BRAD|nr:Solute-binding protein [Rhodoplanes serenus]